MAQLYKDVYGRTYSPDQVEKVGGSYYVAGTSINVSPVSSSSGSKSSSTTTSASKSSSSSSSTTTLASKPSSSGSSGGTVSPEEVEAELGMGGMLMPQTQVRYGGASGGGYYVPTETGWTKTSTPPQSWTAPYEAAKKSAEYWQTTPEAYAARNAYINALLDRIKQLESQLTNWQPPSIPSPKDWLSPSLPTPATQTPTPPPTVETAPQVENVPAAATPQATPQQTTALPAGVSQGAGGFTYQATTPPILPTVDKLLETYRRVFGKADQDVQQYLQSPEFQTVLRGNVPMWMEADPLWRRYLQMLGISRKLQQNQ